MDSTASHRKGNIRFFVFTYTPWRERPKSEIFKIRPSLSSKLRAAKSLDIVDARTPRLNSWHYQTLKRLKNKPVCNPFPLQVLHTTRYLSGKVVQLFCVDRPTRRETIEESWLEKKQKKTNKQNVLKIVQT
jgi:hypothetical protein